MHIHAGAIAVCAIALGACADASGAIIGGEVVDPSDPITPVVIGDGGALDAFVDLCADAGDRGSGSTYTDLYRDFFGPTGLASCTARSICHVPNGTGALTSGFTCAPDRNACFSSMTTVLVPPGSSASPEHAELYRILRKAPPTPGSGPMPRNSAFAFCPDDLARIEAWIAAGTPND
jgi:hypothetical protein